MSEYQEFTGKTVEEALKNAREEFGVSGLQDLDFEILTQGSRGVLGMGAEVARIIAAPRSALGGSTPKKPAAPSAPPPAPAAPRRGPATRDQPRQPCRRGGRAAEQPREPRPRRRSDDAARLPMATAALVEAAVLRRPRR